jgi:hypothetical protein
MDQDEIEDFWKDLVRAKINHLVCHTPTGGHTNDNYARLECEVNKKIDEVLAFSTPPESMYLTPQQWLEWYGQLFSAIIGIAVLGAGFTFGLIFASLEKPSKHDETYVRKCITASWMLFVLSLGWASFFPLLVSVNRKLTLEELKKQASNKAWYGCRLHFFVTPSILIAQLLPVGAFIASAEAMRQYYNGLGIATLTLVSLIGAAAIGAWAGQNM